MSLSSQEVIEELASSLSETLVLHFPQGPPPPAVSSLGCDDDDDDEKQFKELVTRWLGELLLVVPEESLTNDDNDEQQQQQCHQGRKQHPDDDENKHDGVVGPAIRLAANDRVLQLAVQQWKDTCKQEQQQQQQSKAMSESTTPFTSFSLLDRLSAMPDRTIPNLDAILNHTESSSSSASNNMPIKQQLRLLQQVEHVDNVAAAAAAAAAAAVSEQEWWNKVLHVMFLGLTTTTTTEGGGNGDNDNEDYARTIRDFMALHVKWFQQCSETASEYTWLAFGLCHNLVKALGHYSNDAIFAAETSSLELPITTNDNNKNEQVLQLVFEMMQHWQAMWMSAVATKHNNDCLFAMEDSNQMAFDMMQLLRNHLATPPPPLVVSSSSTSSSSVKFVLRPAHLMALVDPYADWFAAWVGAATGQASVVSPVVSLVLSSGLFHDILGSQCQSQQGHVTMEWKQDMTPESGNSSSTKPLPMLTLQLERALWAYSLCMIRSILVTSRVLLFPWKELLPDDGGAAARPLQVGCLLHESASADHHDSSSLTMRPGTCAVSPPTVEQITIVLNYFMTLLQTSSRTDARLTAICCEAIETILWGINDKEMHRRTLQCLETEARLTSDDADRQRHLTLLLKRICIG